MTNTIDLKKFKEFFKLSRTANDNNKTISNNKIKSHEKIKETSESIIHKMFSRNK